jgi:hypothetical protein
MAPAVNVLPDLPEEKASLSLCWKENPAAKKLLDALVSILKEEYIQTAKNNPEIFSK